MLTGMGNGSVFGAAMMCLMGRGGFQDWGGWGGLAYTPTTFDGFVNWCMIVFGIAYSIMLMISMNRHEAFEKAKA
jgi:hypothetical protein